MITGKKRFPEHSSRKETAPNRKISWKETKMATVDQVKQETAVKQLITPPGTPKIAVSSGYALRKEDILQDHHLVEAPLPDNRKRKLSSSQGGLYLL